MRLANVKGLLPFVLVILATNPLKAEMTIENLAWMTGTWRGSIDTMEIEEIWNEPKAGSIQALVRIINEDKTLIHELIVIDQHNDTLRLFIQQWDPGMGKREPESQTMTLIALKNREVSFEANDDGPLKKLTYRRVSETDFEIDVEHRSGQAFTVELTRHGD